MTGQIFSYTFSGKRNSFREFVLICRKNGKLFPEGHYHTDDKGDALATLHHLQSLYPAKSEQTDENLANPVFC